MFMPIFHSLAGQTAVKILVRFYKASTNQNVYVKSNYLDLEAF